MSYQVLEQWASLGIGAAILPKSKLAASGHAARPIVDKSGREVTIGFDATWSRTGAHPGHLRDFATHLRKVVPGIISGLGPGTRS